MDASITSPKADERADLLAGLAIQRHFLRFTVRDLTDEQAARTPTASALCLGGIIQHVADVESTWADFIRVGPSVFAHSPEAFAHRTARFSMEPGQSLSSILDDYARVASRTTDLVNALENFDAVQPLPAAPWFEPGAQWSARRVLLHLIAETAQHAGHADIIRETIDGSKTMG